MNRTIFPYHCKKIKPWEKFRGRGARELQCDFKVGNLSPRGRVRYSAPSADWGTKRRVVTIEQSKSYVL